MLNTNTNKAFAQINEVDSLQKILEEPEIINPEDLYTPAQADSIKEALRQKDIEDYNKAIAKNRKQQDSLKQVGINKKYLETYQKNLALKRKDSLEFVLDGNVYKKRSGWFTGGAGSGFSGKPIDYKNALINIAFNFNISKSYIRLNYTNIRIPNKVFRDQYMSVSIGDLKNKNKTAISYFFGLSYSFLWQAKKDSIQTFRQLGAWGVYSEVAFFYKPLYDIGIGPALFINLDFVSPLVGIRLDLYFANSFKRKYYKNINQ